MQITIQYVWLAFSLGLFFIWLVIFLSLKNREGKKEMLLVSLWTSLLGLTEPLFVPEYWNPPSLFNLAQKTGFDIESIIFSFAVGGIAAVIYETTFKTRHAAVPLKEKLKSIHKLHYFFLSLSPLVFLLLWIFTEINPIYSAIAAMFVGAMGAVVCRKDLARKVLAGGILFSGLYFIFFVSFNWAFPGYIARVWNLDAISGILISGVPLEELLFAFTLGMLWSGLYEHLTWRT